MPATGTPEPGGLFWDETLDIIKIAAKNSKIVTKNEKIVFFTAAFQLISDKLKPNYLMDIKQGTKEF